MERNANRPPPLRTRLRRFVRETRGIVLLEYTVLVGFVGIASASAFVSLGLAFVRNFDFVRGMLLTPFP